VILPSSPTYEPGFRRPVKIWVRPSTNYGRIRRSPTISSFTPQQAAEKSLKTFLSWHHIPFRKTHNLVELGEACCQIDRSLEPLLRRAAPLTEYAWKFRYPADPDEATADEADDALATAREVFDTILRCLPSDVRP
jgi:HEPN domain-containing protein